MEIRDHQSNVKRRGGAVGWLGLPLLAAALVACFWFLGDSWLSAQVESETATSSPRPHPLQLQSLDEAAAKDLGCLSCHDGIEKMHAKASVAEWHQQHGGRLHRHADQRDLSRGHIREESLAGFY